MTIEYTNLAMRLGALAVERFGVDLFSAVDAAYALIEDGDLELSSSLEKQVEAVATSIS